MQKPAIFDVLQHHDYLKISSHNTRIFGLNMLKFRQSITSLHKPMTNTIIQPNSASLTELSDSVLLQRAEHFGKQARLWRQKFLGLLPEINKRELFRQKGFDSIFVFAFMLGGVRELQVRSVLRLEKKLEATPTLHTLLIEGEVSHHKLDRIASIAKPNNENFLANQVQLLSQRSLDTLVKDEKHDTLGLCAQTSISQHNLSLAEDVEHELIQMQQKGIDIDAELRAFLQQRKREITAAKEMITESPERRASRYISKKTHEILQKEYGTKCAKEGCSKPSENIHHTARYGLTNSHNLLYLAPLCKAHHEIAHSIDIKVQKKKWRKL